MYKELRKQIVDRKIINTLRYGLEKRIKYKIDNQLGLKGMSFQEVKIQMATTKLDKYTKIFADIEELDNDRKKLLEEEKIIDDILENVNQQISVLNDIELKVFKNMYMEGKTQQEIANAEGYSIDRIKQISREINKKIKDYTSITPI